MSRYITICRKMCDYIYIYNMTYVNMIYYIYIPSKDYDDNTLHDLCFFAIIKKKSTTNLKTHSLNDIIINIYSYNIFFQILYNFEQHNYSKCNVKFLLNIILHFNIIILLYFYYIISRNPFIYSGIQK